VYDNEKLRLKNVKTVYTSREVVILSEDERSELVLGDNVITSPVPGAYEGMPIKLPEALVVEEPAVEPVSDDEQLPEEIVSPEASQGGASIVEETAAEQG
jgi:hypothetical protein